VSDFSGRREQPPPYDDGDQEPVWSFQPGAFLLYLIAGGAYIIVGALVPEILLSLLYGYAVVIGSTWLLPVLIRRAWRWYRRP
jgi:hypothetical protein